MLLIQKASKEPILEEAEIDFKSLDECEEGQEEGQAKETKETEPEGERKGQAFLFVLLLIFEYILSY